MSPAIRGTVTKRTSATEARVQAAVAARCPGTTPDVIEFRADPRFPGTGDLLMNDLTVSGFRPLTTALAEQDPAALAGYGSAVGAIARVHAEFLRSSLGDAGLPRPPTVAERSAKAPRSLDLPVLPAGDPQRYRALAATLEHALSTGPPASWPAEPSTLVHGDLHPGNIWIDAAGSVLLLDWGEALTGPAAWDLAMLPAQCLRSYLQARMDLTPAMASDFLDQVRWATTVRSAYLINQLARLAQDPAQAAYAAAALTALETALSLTTVRSSGHPA